jgi:D-sedoheptulose 7-phosphate isomerase
MVFAQQVFGYGRPGDALIAISTSGTAANVINAVKVALALDLKTIALTGERGTVKELAEVTISVPGSDTARIQEYHMAIYHTLCAVLEAELFPG